MASSLCSFLASSPLLVAEAPLVARNDEIDLAGVRALLGSGQADCIVISPGPGTPEKAADIGEGHRDVVWHVRKDCRAPAAELQARRGATGCGLQARHTPAGMHAPAFHPCRLHHPPSRMRVAASCMCHCSPVVRLVYVQVSASMS